MSTDPMAESQAWLQWLEAVSDEERQKVAELLGKFDTSTTAGMHQFILQLQLAAIAGQIAPVMLPHIRQLADRSVSMLIVEHQAAGALNALPTSTAQLMVQMQQTTIKAVQPKYALGQDAPDPTDVVEGQVREALPVSEEAG